MQHPNELESIRTEAELAANALVEAAELRPGQIVVIGCSTSEVIGQRIGTSGTLDVANALYEGLQVLQSRYQLQLAFQCCEHLNRALVIERSLCETMRLEEVSAIPVPRAGGSMPTIAYRNMSEPCVVEHLSAHAGMDIGETLIGMHLRHVAVPLRTSVRTIGAARVTMATSRPKLIGGERAIYRLQQNGDSDTLGDCT
ncbi:TIGR01440 family protein [Paenibacillus sp. SC116]|uniref:TIGR01440 family protein n=1 Tax=Paenibacillus sp. SC116 TaxID=2968986 RepID=UPI00215AFA7F|nr:TIGR01440 family protein [Paenibacillus sp. SC116]MCR8844739.1 TIGR01440 family protein [Paenibacillus sp. SC116]